MQEFELPVTINGTEHHLNARLVHAGYIYKIEVDVGGATVGIERDEEGAWRAIISEQEASANKITREFLTAIVESIEDITK